MSTDGPPEEQPTNSPPGEQPPIELPIGDQPIEEPPGYAAPPPFQPPESPPNSAPLTQPPGPPPRGNARQFIIGLLLGAIPLLIALAGLGSMFNVGNSAYYSALSNLLVAGGVGYVIGLILSIILTIVRRTRRVGLGMLTALLASPVIFFLGCLVAISHPVA